MARLLGFDRRKRTDRWMLAHAIASCCCWLALTAAGALGGTDVPKLVLLMLTLGAPVFLPISLAVGLPGDLDDPTYKAILWMTYVPSFVAAARWLASPSRRERRLANGLCVTCGYDLRATPDRCPECGTPVPPKQASEAAAS